MGEIAVVAIQKQHIKNKNKSKLLTDIFIYRFLFYVFIDSPKFLTKETRAYDIAHNMNPMSSLLIQNV